MGGGEWNDLPEGLKPKEALLNHKEFTLGADSHQPAPVSVMQGEIHTQSVRGKRK